MSDAVAVVWDDTLLGYTMGGDHPMHPVRLDLTIRLPGAPGGVEQAPAAGPAPPPARTPPGRPRPAHPRARPGLPGGGPPRAGGPLRRGPRPRDAGQPGLPRHVR